MNIPSMDEMIKECMEKKTTEEAMVFGFGVGRVIPLLTDDRRTRKAIKAALKYINSLDGFQGIHPISLWKNLLLFDTLNNAKGGRNLLNIQDCNCGEIVPILVKEEYLRRMQSERQQDEEGDKR